ncbi:MAG TPA: HAMP domain-containing sensor histidine kinase [Gemmatimonadaceae bacterium]|nr:HAMP domain-containing sensor histidine kinase [Gemmatimonadaceae bacterium]
MRWSPDATSLRLRWPMLVLLASIGLTALAVVDAQRAARSNQAVARRALREYATFAAWSYRQHLEERFAALAREALGAVNHGDNLHTNPEVPPARELAHYLPWDSGCACHRTREGPQPALFLALRLGSDSLDVGVNTHPHPLEGWEVDQPLLVPAPAGAVLDLPDADRRWVIDTLTRRVRAARRPDHGFTLLVDEGGRGNEGTGGARRTRARRVLAYTLMPTSWGDTLVYGAWYAPAALDSVLGAVLDGSGLLPSTFTAGRRNRDVLTVRVRDRAGRLLFDSAPGLESPLAAHLELEPRHGALRVDALIRPEVAGSLLVGGLPRSRLPFLLALLGLAAALSLVAVAQLRREGELARARADFVSSVSHELRTPLAQIRLYLETLRLGRATTPAQREWSLAHIDRETTRLGHLVENVLRFSRLGGDDASAAAPVDVGGEARRVLEEFAPLAASRRATLDADLADGLTAALRPDALRHVLLNLLDNAVKYGPPGQTVRVRVARAGDAVHLAVADEGPGVAPTERERIWRPFARGAAARATGGSGIGLTIVRSIAERHEGRVWVEEAPGGGARFVAAFPLVAATATAAAARAATDLPAAAAIAGARVATGEEVPGNGRPGSDVPGDGATTAR